MFDIVFKPRESEAERKLPLSPASVRRLATELIVWVFISASFAVTVLLILDYVNYRDTQTFAYFFTLYPLSTIVQLSVICLALTASLVYIRQKLHAAPPLELPREPDADRRPRVHLCHRSCPPNHCGVLAVRAAKAAR